MSLMISGYASIFGVRDLIGEVVMPGAFARSLRSWRRVRMLFKHDPAHEIGEWTRIEEDEPGLLVQGVVDGRSALGSPFLEAINSGVVDGLSIGFHTVRDKRLPYTRLIYEVDLWEISLVAFPLHPQARFSINAPMTEGV